MKKSFSPSLAVRKFLNAIEYAMSFVLFYSGFLRLYSRLILKRRLAIVFYHEIGDVPELAEAALSPDTFERQMALVARWRRGISIDRLHECLAGGRRLPDYPVLVTFDGGYRGVMDHAVPILRRHRIPATIYLVTGSIDDRKLPHAFRIKRLLDRTRAETLSVPDDGGGTFGLRTERERELCRYALMRLLGNTPPGERNAFIAGFAAKLGVEPDTVEDEVFSSWEEIAAARNDELVRFESHSVNHPNLLGMPPEEARREITESKEAIERKTGRAVTSFCYPMGFYSEEIKAMVRSAGYHSATTVRFGLNGCGDDPMELKRIAVHRAPLCVFAIELCGIYLSGTMMRRFDSMKSRLKGMRRGHARNR